MNKLFTFLASAALVGSFTACSSDEPAKGADQGTNPEDGTTMYLNVNISDANSMSRAEEGDLVAGDKTEHDIKTAHFFFFDADGMFVTQANIWTGGSAVEDEKDIVEDQVGPNIEFKGNNVLVLKNLTKNNLPKYLITVLNAPTSLITYIEATPRSMTAVRNELMNCRTDKGLFTMSTSSFYGQPQGETDRYEDGKYYATVLKTTDFYTEPKTTISDDEAVKVYVERLAVKYTIDGITGRNPFEVDVTIAGNSNDQVNPDETNTENPGTGIAATKVKVTLLNFAVTGVEENSYLSKNLDDFSASNPAWAITKGAWNIADLHRSYWAQSPNYNVADNLTYPTFTEVDSTLVKPYYSNETTKDWNLLSNNGVLNPSQVTNIVFTAQVTESTDEGDKPLDLVLFSGVYYRTEQFPAYIFNRLNSVDNRLNFYRWTATEEVTEEGLKKAENFKQVSTDDVTIVKKNDGKTGTIEFKSNIGNDTKLYAKNGSEFSLIENGAAEFEKTVNKFFAAEPATKYTDGKMYYTIPVEHLLSPEGAKNNYKITTNGEWGVVRNHWYQITVDKLFRLGQGVFDPNEGSTEELIPDNPNKETFAMGAQVKILSWKIVKQTVDL